MPKEGPDGRSMYEPREAYDAVGRRLYPAAWELFFHTGPPLPHRPDDNDQQYRFRQIRARRSSKAFSDLTEALYWGKSAVWTYDDEHGWTVTSHEEWGPGSRLVRVLQDDLEGVITRNEPARTAPTTMSRPWCRIVVLVVNHKVAVSEPIPLAVSSHPWPVAPTSRMSTANNGIMKM